MTGTAPQPNIKKVKHPYYSFMKLLSFNAMYNFAVGGRGIGKTYGAKLLAVKDFIRKGEEFIYLRRYKEELSAAIRTFMDDLKANDEFADWDFRINGKVLEASGAEFRDEKKREWRTVGYFISLSTTQSQKSVAFPRVTKIIFDEFIIEKGNIRYIQDENVAFNNFYSTVDRGQDKTKVFFLANSVSIMNPYFIEYSIDPAEGPFVRRAKLDDGTHFIVCEFVDSTDYAQSLKSTKFGQFIRGSEYEMYAVGNVFLDNNDTLLEFKDETARYIYTLKTMKGTFSIWYSGASGNYYAQERLPKEQTVNVTDPRLMEEGYRLLIRSDKRLQMLRTAFGNGRLMFDTARSRNGLLEIFK
ncbi:terminase [Curtobacterium phage Reje]|uniref:terminase n=1 Tax=Curtobacterium phage Reje TaxID=2851069 RepID=UPI0021FB6F8E|nr:terminase [Curtobacterium phage Reje]QXG07821.1 terminase [Curtobacterium phage Reje]